MKKAIAKAGFKLGGGLLLVGALIGVRIVTADPDGLQGELEELEAFEAELSADADPGAQARGAEASASSKDEGESGLVARVSATVRDGLSGEAPGPDPNRLVRCDLGGGVQFMRAADCQSRGGDLTDVDR
jgi:hypothetical protein